MKNLPINSDKKFKYSITFQSWDEESLEVGQTDNQGFIERDEVDTIGEILHKANSDYGIYMPVSFGTWESTEPIEDKDYFEKGIKTYFGLHLKNEDGTEISEEENDFITFLLSDGRLEIDKFREYAVGGLVAGAIAVGIGGLIAYYYFKGKKKASNKNNAKEVEHNDIKYPIKDAWRREHKLHNKAEDYEVPKRKRKRVSYAEGGEAGDYFTMKDGSKISKNEWYQKMQEKLGFEKFAERQLKDAQFGRKVNAPLNELTHNRLDKKAVIGKNSVTISSYTPNYKRHLDSITFYSIKELDDYLNKNQILAEGGMLEGISQEDYFLVVQNWVYFTFNYPSTFQTSLSEFHRDKFSIIYQKNGADAVIPAFWKSINDETKYDIAIWVKNNYVNSKSEKEKIQSISDKDYYDIVVNWNMFCQNPPMNFIEDTFGNMAEHFESKWVRYYSKSAIGSVNRFFVELSGDNQERLTNWVYKNFKPMNFAGGGLLSQEELEKNAEIYFSENYNLSKSELSKDLEKYTQMKEDLNEKRITPRQVVGTGYVNARKVANEWINGRIQMTSYLINHFDEKNRLTEQQREQGQFAGGGSLDLSMREKVEMYSYLDDNNWTLESFMARFNKDEEEADDIIMSWAKSRGYDKKSKGGDTTLNKNIMKKTKGSYAGGGSTDLEYSDILNVLQSKIEDSIDEIPTEYENSDTYTGEEIEHEYRDGFIPYTDGGYQAHWFEFISQMFGAGYTLPTKQLEDEMQRQIQYSLDSAKENFIEKYPEIVEELGEENIDYNSLYEAGYGEEAEELSNDEMDMMSEDTILMRIFANYYNPENSRAKDGKHTIRLFGDVNLESPYHRTGNLDDSYEYEFTFDSIAELESEMDKGLEQVISWFKGDMYNDSTTEMKVRRMADGGLLTHQTFFIVDKDGVPLGYKDGYIIAFDTDNLLRHQEDWEGETSDFDVVSEKLLLDNNYDFNDVNGTIYYDATKGEKIVFGEELQEPYLSFYLKQINENSFAGGGKAGKTYVMTDDTYVNIFLSRGFTEKRSSYGLRFFEHKPTGIYITYDPRGIQTPVIISTNKSGEESLYEGNTIREVKQVLDNAGVTIIKEGIDPTYAGGGEAGEIEKPYQVYNYDTQSVEGYFENEIEAEEFAKKFKNATIYDIREYADGGRVNKMDRFISDLAKRNTQEFSVDDFHKFRNDKFKVGVVRQYFADTDANFSEFDEKLGEALNIDWESQDEYAEGGRVNKMDRFISDLAKRNTQEFSVNEFHDFRNKNFEIGVARRYFTETDSNFSKFDDKLGDALNVDWENQGEYADGGEVEDWMEEALESLIEETGFDDLEITMVSDNGNEFYCTDGNAEYRVFKTEDDAEEKAIEQVREDMEESPENFNQDFIKDYIDGREYFEDALNEMNYSYAYDIQSEKDDKYESRLIAEMVEWGILDEVDAHSSNAEEIANDNIDDFVVLLTNDQLEQGNNGLDYFISNFGEEETMKMVIDNNLIDIDEASKDAVQTDGIGHFLSYYDGETLYLKDDCVAYRVN